MRSDNGQTDELEGFGSVDYPWVSKALSGQSVIAPPVAQRVEGFSVVYVSGLHGFLGRPLVSIRHVLGLLGQGSPQSAWVGIGKAAHPAVSGTARFIERLAERWNLSNQDLAILLGLDSADIVSDMLQGANVLRGRDAEDRVANLFRIYEALYSMLRDEDAEREWIRQPIDFLGGQSCLGVMLNGGVEDLVDIRRAVEHFAGR